VNPYRSVLAVVSVTVRATILSVASRVYDTVAPAVVVETCRLAASYSSVSSVRVVVLPRSSYLTFPDGPDDSTSPWPCARPCTTGPGWPIRIRSR